MPLLSLLGLFKDDEHLRADNFDQMQERRFRTSIVSPFAANVAFILHKCEEIYHSEPRVQSDLFKVQILVNEKPVKFPFCDAHLCPYSLFRERYAKYVDSCDMVNLCKLSETVKDEL